mgnify:CR=1 FL=1
MTSVEFYVDKHNIIYGFRIEGHSGYSDKGNDIVCASISTIAQMVEIELKLYGINSTIVKEDGFMVIFVINTELIYTAQYCFKTAKIMLNEIAIKYQDNVRFKEVLC